MCHYALHDQKGVGEIDPVCVCVVAQVLFGKGCFLGVPVLMASAELEVEGLPGWELATSPLEAT